MVTGVVIPGMGGLELARQFRALYPGTPFLIMSGGGATPENIRDARDLSAHRFLSKPFRMEELIQVLVEALADEADAF